MTVDVVVSMVSDTFSDSVRRGFYSTADQLILSLLESSEVGTVLVADHPRGLLSQVRRRLSGDRPAPHTGRLRGVRPAVFSTPTPTAWDGLVRRYRAYDTQIAAAAAFHRMRRPALVAFNLWHAAAAESGWAGQRLFYAQDDEAAIPRLLPFRDLTARAYAGIDAGPAAVVAVSSELLGRISPARDGLTVANGVDPDLWWTLPRRPRPGRGAPVAVYAGTVDARLDTEAFRQLGAAGYDVRVLGGLADTEVRAALQGSRGVTLLGARPRREVVSELRRADLCLLAHRDSTLTRAMSPLKLFEYVASGTPVVATDLPGTREAALPVQLVPPGGDYVAAARAARTAGPLDEVSRRTLVARMSWRVRHREVVDLLS